MSCLGLRHSLSSVKSAQRRDLYVLGALVVVAVAQRRLGPSSSATSSTTDRALPSSAVQLRCWSRPTTTTRLPFDSDCAACSAWSRHTTTVKNEASCFRRPDTATRNMARAIPPSVCRSSGSSVRLPAKLTLASVMVCPFLLPGRAVCPALGTGGRWTPWHATRLPGASDRANEVGRLNRTAGHRSAQEPGWLVGRLR